MRNGADKVEEVTHTSALPQSRLMMLDYQAWWKGGVQQGAHGDNVVVISWDRLCSQSEK